MSAYFASRESFLKFLLTAVVLFSFSACQSPGLQPVPSSPPPRVGPGLSPDPLEPEPSDPDAACVIDTFRQQEDPSEPIRKVDILFVMDTSGSMLDDWRRVAHNISGLTNVLDPDVHIRMGVLLGHVGPWRGKLFSGKSESGRQHPRVFDTTTMSTEEISQGLFDTFEAGIGFVKRDAGSGETTFYSLYSAITEKLSHNKALGFFRDDAALSVVFMSDEHEIGSFFPVQSGVPRRCDETFEEGVKSQYYDRLGLTAGSLAGVLQSMKGVLPVSAHAFVNITLEDLFKNNDRNAECLYDSLGYGYFDIVSATEGVLYSLQDDRSEGMERIGIAVSRDLQLAHRFKLSRSSSQVDADTIEAKVDSVIVNHRYNSGNSTVFLANAGRAGSLIEIKHCKPEVEPVEWDINALRATTGEETLTATWNTGEAVTKATFFLGLNEDDLSDRIVPIIGFSRNHVVRLDGLEPGTRYFFKVRAEDRDGVVRESAILSAVTKFREEPPILEWDINALRANTGEEILTATWNTGEVVTKATFFLGRSEADLSDRIVPIIGFSRDHVVRLDGLEPGTRYFFKVRAEDRNGLVRESAILSAVTKSPEPPPPLVWEIRGLDGATTDRSLSVIWRTPGVDTTAIVHIGLSEGDLSLRSISASTPSDNHIVGLNGLEANTRYYFQVVATDANGDTRTSEIISKVTKSVR